ncbi:beta-glucosidase [Enterococcus sp. AZ194]|uniref:glycoside hydrolase family 3 N-terminal domain-containing protein n=1 Tax=Enterococcus sp. AZ194 TaxID=2774629 RepID=UPI003F21950C
MNVEQLLQQMTLKEKVGQLNQRLYGWEVYEKKEGKIHLTEKFKQEVSRWGSIGCIYGIFRSDPWSGKNRQTGLSVKEAIEVSRLVQAYLNENTRLKIPTFLSEECPHGHQALDSLTTPANYSVGMSWNPTLYQRVQEIVAREIRAKGAHLGLISSLDVSRDPRWGRTEECFSEDPFLTSQYTAAALHGLQNTTDKQIDKNHVLAVLKHFAAQGSGMGGHNSGPVAIGQREFREIHLPPMITGIKHGAQMTMAAYNDIDGLLCHGNKYLLTDLLREELGFTGAVMADGCALDRLVEVSEDPVEAAIWGITSGVDLSLWDEVYPYLEEAVTSGRLAESVLDQAVLRILSLKNKMGLFENATPAVTDFSASEKKQASVALAKEAIVLLKNENKQLPLDKESLTKLAVIGPNANQLYNQLGDYTPFKNEEDCFTILKGIQEKCQALEITVGYEKGSEIATAIEGGIEAAISVGKKADKIIVVLGGSSARDFTTAFDSNGAAISGSTEMTSGENIDVADLRIPEAQVKLVKKLSKLGKPMVGLLIQGRPHILTDIEPYFDSLLVVGYPGEHGGQAVASILFDESPSGKLAMSIPKDNGQLPAYYNYREVAFKKDYVDCSGSPQFPFGYGLSYSTFEVTNLAITVEEVQTTTSGNKQVLISGILKNTGDYPGAEVIQVYLKSHQKRVVTRVKELRGFKKIYLEPNESQSFTIKLTASELVELDEQLIYQTIDECTLFVEATGTKFEQRLTL